MTAPQDEPVAWMNPISKRTMNAIEKKNWEKQWPAQCLEFTTPLYAQPPAAIRAAAIAECARVGRNLYNGDGGRLDAYDEGWNDGVEAAECAIRALSPRPTVSEEWIASVVLRSNDGVETLQDPNCRNAVRAALQSLGYEVTK